MPNSETETELMPVPTSEGMELMPVQVRYSKRAKNFRLTLGDHGEALLTIPHRCSKQSGVEFLKKHGDWIKKHQPDPKAKKPTTPLLDFLKKQGWVSIAGHKAMLDMQFGGERSTFNLVDDWKRLQLQLVQSGDIDDELSRLFHKLATLIIPPRVSEIASFLRLKISKVGIRNQKSRWGSCSDLGNISLNWRLLLLKPHLHDYIILHELAHLSEMNHSDRFWSVLETYDPKARLHDKELSKVSRNLISLGR